MPQDKFVVEVAKRERARKDGIKPRLPKDERERRAFTDAREEAFNGVYGNYLGRTPAQKRKDNYGERTTDVRLK